MHLTFISAFNGHSYVFITSISFLNFTAELWKPLKELTQIRSMCRITQQGRHAKNLLQSAQCRTMGVMNRIRVTSTFRVRGKYNHPDGTISPFAFIPGDEDD